MQGKPGREQNWHDERFGAQDQVSWDELLAPQRDPADVYQGLAEAIGWQDARPRRTAREPLPDVGDLREQIGL